MKLELPFLPSDPPLVWPEPRWYAQAARYETQPPFEALAGKCGLIAGVLVGVSDATIKWIDALFHGQSNRRIVLVILVFPTGPTREEHLLALKMLQAQVSAPESELEIRVLPVERVFGHDFEKPVLPPTALLAHDTNTGRSWLCIGSVGDAGRDAVQPASFNVVFQPDDALRDQWRRWFQYLFARAVPLTPETVRIPHLVPAPGDPAAVEMWSAFAAACGTCDAENIKPPVVDQQTGEVTAEPGGAAVKPWDGGATALDPLAQKLQQVYARGWLVTMDETTRIKPLAIPVKATLLGQQSERMVGALTHKQSFSLQVLDDAVAKEIEKCRRVTDLMDLVTYLLSLGNRWLPEAAKALLEKELAARNAKGIASLKAALGGGKPGDFVSKRRGKITEDLNAMYKQLGQGFSVPDEKLAAVLAEVEKRLGAALESRITPRAVYNRIAPPDLTATAPKENWSQPLSLLLRSARLLRESVTDAYFPRRFAGLSFTEPDFQAAMNIFDDSIAREPASRRALVELKALDEIEAADQNPKEKCAAVWQIISGSAKP